MTVLRSALAAFMVFAGVMHFARPRPFVKIVPAWMPWPRAAVAVSGVAEVLLGAMTAIPATHALGGYGLALLFVAVFPANVNQAVNDVQFSRKRPIARRFLWARLPLQLVLVAWAVAVARSP